MRLLYSRQANLGALLIRSASWFGPWSHVALIDGDDVIESRALKRGVVRTPLWRAVAHASEHEVVTIPTPNDAAGLAWARQSVGAPYDWGGVFGILARERDWQSPEDWYCSEHAERALVEAGLTGELARWRPGLMGITPCMSYYNRRGL